MKLLLVVELVCALLENVHGLPWYNYGIYNRRNTFRQSPRYRNQNTDNNFIDDGCNGWKFQIEDGRPLHAVSRKGDLCIKSQATVNVLTWCTNDELNKNGRLYLRLTVADSRESSISNCPIYDVSIHAESSRPDSCFFTLTDGLLMCVDESVPLSQNEILSIFPTVEYNRPTPKVNYLICNTSMASYCPGLAKIASIVVDEEVQYLKCVGSQDSGYPC